MFQDNPLSTQLKQQLHPQTPRAEGIVKGTEKDFSLLEADAQKSYSIPPPQMKKVMHDDRIVAVIHSEKDRESAEPETLAKPFLTRLVGRVQKKDDRLAIVPDHPLLRDAIPCRTTRGVEYNFRQGGWAVAETRRHLLKGGRGFYVELTQFITFSGDHFVLQWVTLTCHNLGKEAPDGMATKMLDEELMRRDLIALDFVTIDNANTEDVDDTLYTESTIDGKLLLMVTTADPTTWIIESSKLDEAVKVRAFINYLPSFNTPALPRELSDDPCFLRVNEVCPVLACRMTLATDGTIEDSIEFFVVTIESKARLAYDDVSNQLKGYGSWQPGSNATAQQTTLLKDVCQRRNEQRRIHAPVFKDCPDYRSVLGKKGEVLDIIAEPRRIANRIVEESMTAANIYTVRVLCDKLGLGVHNVHTDFDPTSTEQLVALLKTHDVRVDPTEVLTLERFCKLCRELDAQPTRLLDSRAHRSQSSAEISAEPGPHFGLGLGTYATWTSSIHRYGDMANHRLLKVIIKGKTITRLQDDATVQMAGRRRLNQMAERDVADWLYARFLNDKAGIDTRFAAEIIDISHGGMHTCLVGNGVVAFISAPFLHAVCDELVRSQENGTVQIKSEVVYKVTNVIDVTIVEVRIKTRGIIAHPIV